MSERRTELGFERTVCDCRACKINCEFIPGFLLPSDIRRIALHLGYSNPVEFALDNLLASPGAIVVDRGQIRRIRTLAPARRQDGACLFLDEEHRCRIHSVSPYGCSHFDAHQTDEEADLRSSAGHQIYDFSGREGAKALRGFRFKGGGGTDFRPAIAEAAKWNPDLLIYLTDLEGDAGDEPAFPVLWAVPEGKAESL